MPGVSCAEIGLVRAIQNLQEIKCSSDVMGAVNCQNVGFTNSRYQTRAAGAHGGAADLGWCDRGLFVEKSVSIAGLAHRPLPALAGMGGIIGKKKSSTLHTCVPLSRERP